MKEIAIRSMFVAPPGHTFVSWDLAQAESWVVAFLANEPNMKKALMFGDIHVETASVLFDKTVTQLMEIKEQDELLYKRMRYIGKRYNHASAYRMTYMRAAQVINQDSDKPPYVVVTLKESKVFSEKWISHYNLNPWWAEIEQQLNKNRTLVTPYDRIRVFYDAWGNELFKKATADVPQSTVADHLNGAIHPKLGIKGGLREVYKQYVVPGRFRVVNQSHDSFIAEVREEIVEEIIPPVTRLLLRPLVINGETFTIPVDCEVGNRWGELKKRKAA